MKSSTDGKKFDGGLFAHFKRAKPFSALDAVILVIVVAAVIAASVFVFGKKESGSYADVYYKGDLVASYSLSKDGSFALPDHEEIIIDISGGKIAIIENDCPNQICVENGYISRSGERIVCAYHKISIVVRSDGDRILVTGGGE